MNHDVVIYNFLPGISGETSERGILRLHISSPYGERIEDLKVLGAIYHEIEIDRHGMNPVTELKLVRTYQQLIEAVKPGCYFRIYH